MLLCQTEQQHLSPSAGHQMSPNSAIRALRLGLITMAATSVMTRAFQIVLPAAAKAITNSRYCRATVTAAGRDSVMRNLPTAANRSRPNFTTCQMSSQTASLTSEQRTELESKIKDKGDEIRSLKENGISKQDLAPHVDELKALKSQLDPGVTASKQTTTKKEEKKTEEESDYITSRSENYSKWYNDIIRVCDLAEVSPVRGCMVIKPWGMSIWNQIHRDLDTRIQNHGAENAYFPLLIPKSFLSKEAEHVDGFAKECAVVTHHRLTADPDGGGLIADPEAELEDPLIIRPTSETMIWYMFKKWIVSHR